VPLKIVPRVKSPVGTTSARRPERLNIAVTWAEDVALLVLSGELDVSSAGRLGTHFGELLTEVRSDVFVDVSGLTYLDSAGLSALVKAHRAFESRGTRLVIVFPPAQVQRLFEICGLTSLLVVDPRDATNWRAP
jgi:anti-sigma B factor antagonist